MHKVAIAIGSNINPEKNIQAGIEKLKAIDANVCCSEIVSTAPIGITDQSDFLNCAIYLQTAMDRQSLNSRLKQIEDELLRDRSAPKYGPRTIDLDIIIWDGEIVDNDYYERDFVKNSVDEIYPF